MANFKDLKNQQQIIKIKVTDLGTLLHLSWGLSSAEHHLTSPLVNLAIILASPVPSPSMRSRRRIISSENKLHFCEDFVKWYFKE